MSLDPSIQNQLLGQLKPNATLAEYSSWKVGGLADWIYIPHDLKDLVQFMKVIPQDLPINWLGLGSNTLIREGGVEGVVILLQGALNKIEHQDNIFRVEAGVASAKLARHTARLGFTGLEFMAGIPGTVGGAIAMNAGCFGGETWSYLQHVEVMTRNGDLIKREAKDYQVSYRTVKRSLDECFVAGYFKLEQGQKENSLEIIRQLLDRRNSTQPTGLANCGSVFKNPPGSFAGRLIEECGLKGKRVGGASVSTKHANFIINENNATARDIESLINEVRTIVDDKTGVRLMTEVCIIGRY